MYKHKYKPGDIVIVRSDLGVYTFYGGVPFVSSMEEYAGKALRILGYKNEGYKVYENIFTWTDSMFESPTFNMPTKDELNDFLKL